MRPRASLIAAAAAAVVVAVALAVWGLNFGLPYLFRPDEDVLVGRSVRMAAEGSLDPLFANWPPLAFYVVAAAERLTGNLAGATTADPTGAYLTGRVISVVAFAVTVAFVFAAARRAYGEAAAAVAAFVLAVSPLAVRQAHMATIDFLQTMFVVAATLAALYADTKRGYGVAGVLCGLAASVKYTGVLSLVFVLALALQSPRRKGATIAALVGAAIAFAVPGAVMVLHPGEYLNGLAFLGGRGFNHDYGTPLGWFYHPTVTLPFGLGLGAYVMALAGVMVAAAKRERADLALLGLVAAYLLVVGASHEVFWRYALPLLPALAILAGGLTRAVPRRLRVVAIPIVAALLLPSVWASVNTDRLLATTDTRRQAADWLLQNAPQGATIASVYYVSPFYDQAMVEGNRRWVDDELAAGFMQGRYTTRFRLSVDHLSQTSDADYVVASPSAPSNETRPVLAAFSPGKTGDVYDPIDAFYIPIWGFSGVERPGPSIVIYGR